MLEISQKNDVESIHGEIKWDVKDLERTSVSSGTMIIKETVERTRHKW